MPHPLQQRYDEVTKLLLSLRDTALNLPAVPLFDEYLEHNELDMALHAICDSLLESGQPVPRSLLERIAAVHQIMEITDDCVEHLSRQLI